MKLKCVKVKNPGFLGANWEEFLSLGKTYFGQISLSGQYGYKKFVCYTDKKGDEWQEIPIDFFAPVDKK